MMKTKLIAVMLILVAPLVACNPQTGSRQTAVYLLLDTSGTYTKELDKASAIINYLLGTLDTGDSIAVARIDSGSFSEKDILVKATFDDRPSVGNQQKRAIREKISATFGNLRGSAHTDISGAMLQAIEYLNETGAGKKYILVFSDLEEDLVKGHIRDFIIPFDGVKVVALNITKLRSDNIDPREYLDRLDKWEQKVVEAGGDWRIMNDLERLDRVL